MKEVIKATKKKTRCSPKPKKAAKSPITSYRGDNNYLDAGYIEAYCSSPKDGKTAAILKTGYVAANPRQAAYKLHNRLRDKIENRLKGNMADLANLAYHQLKEMLCKPASEVGYSNMGAAIKAGFDYSGHKPSDKIEIIEKEQSFEELQLAIQENERQLKEKTH